MHSPVSKSQPQGLVVRKSVARRRRLIGFLGHSLLFAITATSAVAILFILFFIFRDALPFFREFGVGAFFKSERWYPTHTPPVFGAQGIFVGTALVTIGSCLIAVPMGLFAAITLSDVVPFSVREVVKPIIELLAAIPSVAYGFFALVVFAPLLQEQGGTLLAVALWLLAGPMAVVGIVVASDVGTGPLSDRARRFARPLVALVLAAAALWVLRTLSGKLMALEIHAGRNALNASILLSFMALPTIVSVCEDSLTAVGRGLREGSYALGATRAETMVRVVIPAAKGGILAAVLLGVMRAVGETMVVLMAAGNRFEIPVPWYNYVSQVRTLTGTIALEMGETAVGSGHYHALFALGFCLLLFSFVLNLLSEWAVRGTRRRLKGG